MGHNPPPNISEDYKAWAKLSTDTKELSVPCKIFLPKTILEKPQVYIYPEKEQFYILSSGMFKWHLSAIIGKPPNVEIIGEETHISGGSMRHLESGLDEGYLKIYPTRLNIVYYHKKLKEGNIVFSLTPSLYLSPFDYREYHFNGEAKIRHGERFKFKLNDDFEILFLNQYKWQEIENNKTITFPELVAQTNIKRRGNKIDIEEYLSLLDDFLLLVSFVEGQRCMIPQVSLHLPEKSIDIYRLDRSLPHISAKHSSNDCIISSDDFKDFITNSWKIFQGSNQYKLIKSSLEINSSDIIAPMESRYLSLFSSVETLILSFRIENNIEYIINDKSDWKRFSNELKKRVKSYELFIGDKDKRKLIYQNFSGLNRAPLQYAFNMLVSKKSLYLEDLWPFSNDQSDCSLTTIRNRLVHGYRLDEKYVDSFGEALKNLDYYAKRLLLSSLGWDFNKSRLFRRNESDINAWKKAQKSLKDWK